MAYFLSKSNQSQLVVQLKLCYFQLKCVHFQYKDQNYIDFFKNKSYSTGPCLYPQCMFPEYTNPDQ